MIAQTAVEQILFRYKQINRRTEIRDEWKNRKMFKLTLSCADGSSDVSLQLPSNKGKKPKLSETFVASM